MIFGKKKGVDELFAKITAYLAGSIFIFHLAHWPCLSSSASSNASGLHGCFDSSMLPS